MTERLFNIVALCLVTIFSLAGTVIAQSDTRPKHSTLREVPFDRVQVDDSFWNPRLKKLQEVTIPNLLDTADDPSKNVRGAGILHNFKVVAGRKEGQITDDVVPDSDIYKLLEGASYTLAWRADPELSDRVDQVIDLIADAQADSGYLNTSFMLPADDPRNHDNDRLGYGKELRWNATWQRWPTGIGQLYAAGHLFEAAAAHHRATGNTNFLDVATKMADHIERQFPSGEPIKFADHPQVGIGLVRLYQVTGAKKYLKLANRLVSNVTYSRPPDYGDGHNRKPLHEQRIAWGHAVRVNYVWSAATDLVRYLGRSELETAVHSVWDSILDSRIYLHGGAGGPAEKEQLQKPYVLNSADTYSETCANIGHGMWNHRLNLLTGHAKFADVMEVEAYNGALSGVSLGGNKICYRNVLRSDGDLPRKARRRHYLFCCPSNVPRFLGGISRWIYAKNDDGIFVNLFIGSTADIQLPDREVTVKQNTSYPWQGKTTLTIHPDEAATFDVALRIPRWLRASGPMPTSLYQFANKIGADWQITVNGKRIETGPVRQGYVRIHRQWEAGDTITLRLPMEPRRIHASDKVKSLRGKVAFMRGPMVYALEKPDNPGFDVREMRLPEDAAIKSEKRDDLLGGVVVLQGKGDVDEKTVDFTAIPYYAWQNRGVHPMTTWMYENRTASASPMPESNPENQLIRATLRASTRMHASSTLHALRDGRIPNRSSSKDQPRMAWWPARGSSEWVQASWSEPVKLDRMRLFWFADKPTGGGCALPENWQLLYRKDGQWQPVPGVDQFPVRRDRMMDLSFDAITTDALRLKVHMQSGASAGIHEWIIPTG